MVRPGFRTADVVLSLVLAAVTAAFCPAGGRTSLDRAVRRLERSRRFFGGERSRPPRICGGAAEISKEDSEPPRSGASTVAFVSATIVVGAAESAAVEAAMAWPWIV